jgi:hypothetical protein
MPSTLPSSDADADADADTTMSTGEPQFVRLVETRREPLHFFLDGRELAALQGDTLLTAVLTHQRRVRDSEFSGAPRAGFCLIGACQDCWMRTEDGRRVRACSTLVTEGLRVVTRLASTSGPADVNAAQARAAAFNGDAQ